MIKEKRPFALTVIWIYNRQNMALSASQLGITKSSLGVGWLGELARTPKHNNTQYVN